MGSYVRAHQKLCVHPRPDAHLGTQHTYPVSHPRDAAPACGRCRGRLTDASALLHVPPDPRSHQPGAGAMGAASFPPAPAARAHSLLRPDPEPRAGPRTPRPDPAPGAQPPRPDPAPTLTSRGPDPAAAQQPGQQQPGGRGQRGSRAA